MEPKVQKIISLNDPCRRGDYACSTKQDGGRIELSRNDL